MCIRDSVDVCLVGVLKHVSACVHTHLFSQTCTRSRTKARTRRHTHTPKHTRARTHTGTWPRWEASLIPYRDLYLRYYNTNWWCDSSPWTWYWGSDWCDRWKGYVWDFHEQEMPEGGSHELPMGFYSVREHMLVSKQHMTPASLRAQV